MKDKFNSFSVGDYISFDRTFRKNDYQLFLELSDDSNPLHFDNNYAKNTEFGKIIVPMHLLIAPFSAIVGVGFPGTSSLYLDHEVKVINAVFYNTKVTYSAKIIEKSDSQRVMKLRVIIFSGDLVHVIGILNVKSRKELKFVKQSSDKKYIVKNNSQRKVLVTGASGELGRATIRYLSNFGHKIVAIYRNESSTKKIKDAFNGKSKDIELVKLDLEKNNKYETLFNTYKDITDFIHIASPKIDSETNKLNTVNYKVLKEITCNLIPSFLAKQSGKIIFIASSGLHYHKQGWENYIAAKSSAASFVQGIHDKYMNYGLEGIILSPGFINTKFSEKYHSDDFELLEPEEVAEVIGTYLERDVCNENYIWHEKNQIIMGKYGFYNVQDNDNNQSVNENHVIEDKNTSEELDIKTTVANYLNIKSSEITNMGVDLYPTWDSIKHIQLILFLEKKYNISFSSEEISETKLYKNLEELINEKIANK